MSDGLSETTMLIGSLLQTLQMRSQDHIAAAMKGEHGIRVSQATVSRALRQLRAARVMGADRNDDRWLLQDDVRWIR